MGNLICGGAMCTCTFGMAPSSYNVLPNAKVVSKMPAATIMDNKPMVNIMPFGMCQSLANPQVASATAAAWGVLTPMPCMPVISAPWTPGSPTVMIGGNPALNNSSKCMCNWGGVIGFTTPGEPTIQVP